MKSLNVRLVVILSVAGLILGGGAYFLRAYNVHRTAKFRLDLATEEEVRAELARQRGDLEQAAEAYKEAVDSLAWYVDLEPNDVEMAQKLGLLRADLALDRDVAMRTEVIKQMPKIMGQSFSSLESVLRQDPSRVDARRRLVDVYALLTMLSPDRYTQVRDHVAELPEELRTDGELLEILGRCYYIARRNKEAETTLRQAIENSPQQVGAYMLLAGLLDNRLDRPAEVDDWMTKLVQSNPDLAGAHLEYGNYLERLARRATSLEIRKHRILREAMVPEVLRDSVQRAMADSPLADDDPDASLLAAKPAVLAGAVKRAVAAFDANLALDDPGTLLATAVFGGRIREPDPAALESAQKTALATLKSEMDPDDYQVLSVAEKHGVLVDAMRKAYEKFRSGEALALAVRKALVTDALDHAIRARQLAEEDLKALKLGEKPDAADSLSLAGLSLAGKVLVDALKPMIESEQPTTVLRRTANRDALTQAVEQSIGTQKASDEDRLVLKSAAKRGVLVEALRNALKSRELAAADRQELLEGEGSKTLARIVKRALENQQEASQADDTGALLLAAQCHVDRGGLLRIADPDAWKGEFEKARQYALQGIDLYEDDVRIYDILFNIELQAGRLDPKSYTAQQAKALDCLRQGLQKTDDHVFLLWKIANLLISTGNQEEAEQAIAKLSQKKYGRTSIPPRSVAVGFLRARIAFEREEWLSAIEGFEEHRPGLTTFPRSLIQTDVLLAQCYNRLGNADMELDAYRRVLTADPLNRQAMAGITEAALRSGKIDEGIEQFERLIKLQKLPVRSRILFVRLLIGQNLQRDPSERNWQKVKDSLNQLAQEDPELVDVPILWAEALVAQERMDEARKLLEATRDKHPENAELWNRLVSLAQKQEDWDRVETLLDEAEQKLGDLVALRISRAGYLVTRYKKDGIARLDELAKNTDEFSKEDLWKLLSVLARLAWRYEEWDRAERLLDDAQQKVGDTLGLRVARAQYLMNRYRQEAGPRLRELAENLEEFPEADQLRLWRIFITFAMQARDGEQAKRLGKLVLAKKPTDVKVRFLLFELASRNNDSPAMTEMLAEIKKVEGAGPMWHYGKAAQLSLQAKKANDKELNEALDHLEQAAEKRPSWSQLPLLTATIYFQQGDYDKALEDYLKAFNLGDRNPAAIERVTRLLAARERYEEAKKLAQSLENRRIPLSKQFLRLLIELKGRTRDFAGALELSERIAPDSDDYRDHVQLGNLRAMDAERRRIEGKTTEADEMTAKAEEALRRAVELAGDAAPAWSALIQFLALHKRTAEAEQVLEQGRNKIPPEEAGPVIAGWYELLGRPRQAQQMYEKALEAKPEDPTVVRAVANFYLRTDQVLAAERLLEKFDGGDLKATETDVRWARRSLARILIDRGDYRNRQKALVLIQKNTAAKSASAADKRLMVELLPRERRQEAIAILESLGRAAPPEDRFLLAKLYQDAGAWAEARAIMRSLLGSHGDNPQYVATYVQWLMNHNLLSDADVWLKKLEQLSANHFGVTQLRAEWLFLNDRYSDALDLVKGFINKPNAVPRDEADRMRLVAQTMERYIGRLKGSDTANPDAANMIQRYALETETLLRTYIRQRPGQNMLLASFFARQDRLDDALREVENSWSRSRETPLAQTLSVLMKRPGITDGQLQRGIKILQDGLKKFDRAPSLLVVLGDVRANQKDYAAAEAAYREILKLDRNHWIAMNNLAVLLALRETKLDEALELIDRAMKIAGPIPAMRDSRASVYMAQGNTKKALDDLQRGIKLAPTPIKYFHLAQAHQLAGNRPEAVKAMSSALELGLQRDEIHPLEIPTYQKLTKLLE